MGPVRGPSGKSLMTSQTLQEVEEKLWEPVFNVS